MSRGSIRLSGPSAQDPLLIDPTRWPEADLEALVAAIELVRRIGASEALAAWGARELYPGPVVTTADDVRQYARDTGDHLPPPGRHLQMGTDEAAVVDPLLRVRGVEGLRVADASVMPTVTTGNTNAPSIMIGERLAEFVAGHAQAPFRVARA